MPLSRQCHVPLVRASSTGNMYPTQQSIIIFFAFNDKILVFFDPYLNMF